MSVLGLRNKDAAIRIFGDEKGKSRISDILNGRYATLQTSTVTACRDALKIPQNEIDKILYPLLPTGPDEMEFVRFDNVRSPDDLLCKAQDAAWCHDVIYAMRNTSNDLTKLTNYAGRALLEAFRSGDVQAVGFLSNILTVSADQWDNDPIVIYEMKERIKRQIRNGSMEWSHAMQIASSILARKRDQDSGLSYLRYLLDERELRLQEWIATKKYYGSTPARYSAYAIHEKERPEGNVLAPWDLPSLMTDLWIAPEDFAEKATEPIIRRLLPKLACFDRKLVERLEKEIAKAIRARSENIRVRHAKG